MTDIAPKNNIPDLAKRDSTLELLFDLSLQMLCIAGVDGYFKRLNPAFSKTLGYTLEELLTVPFIELIHPDDREATDMVIQKLTQGEPTVNFENRYRHKDGSYRWLSWCSAPAQDGLLFASAVDVTEHKRAEMMFKGLLASAPDATLIADKEGKIVLVNAVAEQLFGFTKSEMIGQPIEIVIPARYHQSHTKHRTNYAAKPHVRLMGAGIELRGICKNGREFPAEISLGPIQVGDDTFIFCAIRDITARKESEQALRSSEERFDLAVKGTNAGIWDWDLRTNDVFYSPRWKSMLGFKENELDNHYLEWEKRLHPDDKARALRTLEAYLQGESPEYELEHRLRHKDGSYRWILARGAAIQDEMGASYRMVGSHIDITDLKKAEKEALHQEAELIAASSIQKRLLPQNLPAIPGLEIGAISYPAEFAAGDHYDFFEMEDGSLSFAISDVSGHGFSSALLMACTHSYLHALVETENRIENILGKMNVFLNKETDEDRFVTMIFGRIDCASRTLHFSSAGHPPGFVLNRSGELKATLDSIGLPLAVSPEVEYRTGPAVELDPGDTVLVLSDGVLEAENPDNEFFGVEQTLKVLRDNLDSSPDDILQKLYRSLQDFTRREHLEDDVTAIIIKCVRWAGSIQEDQAMPASDKVSGDS